jgi:glycosyltransferase involved in cell wall biosynthesis
MHIAIDVSPLETGHKRRGTGVYIKNLIEALEQYESRHSYSFFTRKQKVFNNADIVHYPYFDPFLSTLPINKAKPTVVTVHDLIPLIFPDQFPKGLRGNIIWQIQKTSLAHVQRIITDSKCSQKDIIKIIGYDIDRIDVIPLAPRDTYRPVKEQRLLASVRKKYRIPETFFLYVGDVNWNKNISSLLKAYSVFIHDNSAHPWALVLAGEAFNNNTLSEIKEIQRQFDVLQIQPSVIIPGYVSDTELCALYSQAICLIHPSRYEGFGLPVLEAMACGCPVVTSSASSLSEIAGPALRFNPESINEILAYLREITHQTKEKRSKMINDGYTWVSHFTWRKVAKYTVQSYEKALR